MVSTAGWALAAAVLAVNADDTNLTGRLIVQCDVCVPDCVLATELGDICAAGNIEAFNGGLEVRHNANVGGTLAVGSSTSLGGDLSMGGHAIKHWRTTYASKAVTHSLDADDCGSTLTSSSDGMVFGLPAVSDATVGCKVSFVNTAGNGGALLSISPDAADGIYGTCCGADVSVVPQCFHLSGADGKDLRNPKGSHNKGDAVTMVADGIDGWYALGCDGVWESEP